MGHFTRRLTEVPRPAREGITTSHDRGGLR
jgi:hypothetical protein